MQIGNDFYNSPLVDLAEVTDAERAERVHCCYLACIAELSLTPPAAPAPEPSPAPLTTRLPILLAHQWLSLPPESQRAYLQNFLAAVLADDAKKFKPKVAAADYSKSFSGSAADTKNEKDAAALMRNDGGAGSADAGDDAEEHAANPLLRMPRFGSSKEDHFGQNLDRLLLRRSAPFLKVLIHLLLTLTLTGTGTGTGTGKRPNLPEK